MNSLQIATLEESEISSFVRIQLAAFPSEVSRILYAPSQETAGEAYMSHLHTLRENPYAYFQKVSHPETNQIICCAKWKIYLEERDEEQLDFKTLGLPKEWLNGWKGRAKEAFHRALSQYSRQIVGTRPHYHLDLLMTDPQCSRRGAAGKVIQWGIDQATLKRLPIYLESSEVARPLYERHGFRVIEHFEMDLAQYGGTGVERVTMMLREPVLSSIDV